MIAVVVAAGGCCAHIVVDTTHLVVIRVLETAVVIETGGHWILLRIHRQVMQRCVKGYTEEQEWYLLQRLFLPACNAKSRRIWKMQPLKINNECNSVLEKVW